MNEDSDNPGPLPALDLRNKSDGGNGPLGRGDDREELVKYLQKILVALGYDIGHSGIDGKFGDDTEEAVKQFQEKNKDWKGNLLKVDSLVGPRTSDALNRAMVGTWYELYKTPKELTKDTILAAATEDALKKGISLDAKEGKMAKVVIVKFFSWHKLSAIIHDRFGGVLKRTKVEVRFNDGSASKATTDDQGAFVIEMNKPYEFANIRYNIRNEEFIEFVFYIDVKRIDTDEGVRRRLHNLGYLVDDDLPSALTSFQAVHGLNTTGEADGVTRVKLAAVYDGDDPLVPEFQFSEELLKPEDMDEEI